MSAGAEVSRFRREFGWACQAGVSSAIFEREDAAIAAAAARGTGAGVAEETESFGWLIPDEIPFPAVREAASGALVPAMREAWGHAGRRATPGWVIFGLGISFEYSDISGVWGGAGRERLPSIRAGVKSIGMSVKSNRENLL